MNTIRQMKDAIEESCQSQYDMEPVEIGCLLQELFWFQEQEQLENYPDR